MSQPSHLTFVSAFSDVYGTHIQSGRSLNWRVERFREIASTKIQICLYVDKECALAASNLVVEFPNVKIMRIIENDDCFAYRACAAHPNITLPNNRSTEKDTFAYLILMNSKVEYVREALRENPFESTHFAWIDFNISHVFSDIAASQSQLRNLSTQSLPTPLMAFPGCHAYPITTSSLGSEPDILDSVSWYFCGGFFVGDKVSIERMYALYERYFPVFLSTHRKLVWEVNFWAWLEKLSPKPEDGPRWNPMRYIADHNDSIIALPAEIFASRLRDIELAATPVEFPEISGFFPGSMATIRTRDNQRILNVRFIDYRLTEYGGYIFSNDLQKSRTRNFVCELNPLSLSPRIPYEMSDPDAADLSSTLSNFQGLEDLRLYAHEGRVRFIATSVNYSITGGNTMVVGDYDTESLKLCRCERVEPPEPTLCEKNWTPVSPPKGETGEWFVYRWAPLEIGKIVEGKLHILRRFESPDTIFSRFRGSSAMLPTDNGENLVGVVHFSKDGSPRQYYHALVVLNAATLSPVGRSDIFYFDSIGIEFCTGFEIRDSPAGGEYSFWISRFDRDPLRIDVAVSAIPIIFYPI